MAELRVVVCDLVVRQDALARDEARDREERERAAERQAEELRLVRQAVEREDDEERRRGDGRAREREEDRRLGARVRLRALDDAPLALPRPASPEQQHDRGEQPAGEAAHEPGLRPIAVATATRAAAATSHVTIPSGIGPTWPSPQPPASVGSRVRRT
jgi:hypothetical protein